MFRLVVSHSATKQIQAELVINGMVDGEIDGDYIERDIQKRDRKRRMVDENHAWIPVKVYYNQK